jgi:hypothetical protein
MIGEDLKSGWLLRLMPEFWSIELGIYAVYPSRKELPLKVRCLIDFLSDAFRAAPWETPAARAEVRARRPMRNMSSSIETSLTS